ncbi:MAG: thioredoxin family protein [Halobacteriales archaeon]|nr:thioredoxin family protein [Halobacteriales archaeon]
MALTPSAMVALGTSAPDFALPDTEGRTVRLSDFDGKPLLVMFLCNHCPYVKHIANDLSQVTAKYMAKGVAAVAISSNDVENYPEDSPANMRTERRNRGYGFPYLFDETQQVARDYDAQCTPDFFLYDRDRTLVYRGQFDDARPGNGKPITGIDLTLAVEALLAGKPPVAVQKPSMGCNIKWK